MKRNLLYILLGGLFLSLASCSEDWEDATNKHVYGENENPYLRADAAATVTEKIQFGAGQTHIINLVDYAEVFLKQLEMTVEETLAGLSNGKVVFHCINAPRNAWDKTAPNNGTTGWYFDEMGNICKQDNAWYMVNLNASNKTLEITALESAIVGSAVSLNVGFAINGPDFDNYVRILNNVAIVDVPIEVSNKIPDGDYASFPVLFETYKTQIQERFGMTVDEFCSELDATGNEEGKIHMCAIDLESLKWDDTSAYTTSGTPGFWLTENSTVTTHGKAGYVIFAECSVKDKKFNVGRAPGLAAGSKYTISVGFRDKTNVANLLRFVIHIELE